MSWQNRVFTVRTDEFYSKFFWMYFGTKSYKSPMEIETRRLEEIFGIIFLTRAKYGKTTKITKIGQIWPCMTNKVMVVEFSNKNICTP